MRVYEGTDTRSQDILVGAALAIGMAMWAEHRQVERTVSANALGARAGSGRANPSTGMAGAVPPRPTDVTCIAGVVGAPDRSRPGRSHHPVFGAFLQILGWATLPSVACFSVDPAAGLEFLPVRRWVLPLCPRSCRGHLLAITAEARGHCRRRWETRCSGMSGKISYGPYLWHFPLFYPVRRGASSSLRVLAVGGADGGHHGRGHRFLLSGRGADPPGEDANPHRVEGVVGDQRSVPWSGGDHHRRHPARRPRLPAPFGSSATSTAGHRCGLPSSATRSPGDSDRPCWPASRRTSTTRTSTTDRSSGAVYFAAPSTWRTRFQIR